MSETVIWARCSDPVQKGQMAALENRLQRDGDPIRLHVTTPGSHPSSAREFEREIPGLALVLWIGDALHGPTLRYCELGNLPVIVLLPDPATTASLPRGWLLGLNRSLLNPIRHVFANSVTQLDAFRRAGLDPSRLSRSDGLEDVVTLPDVDPEELREVSAHLGTRPLWLALGVTPVDVAHLVAAHRHAVRRSHRLMLIVVPAREDRADELREAFAATQLNTLATADPLEADEATQVCVAAGPDDTGLWLRLCGLSYLAGSFDGRATIDPFVAAALGSVLIHGTYDGRNDDRLARLATAQATVPIGRPDALGEAVERLLSVSEAARHAANGWDVVSRGAELTNALVALIFRLTDGTGS